MRPQPDNLIKIVGLRYANPTYKTRIGQAG